jgi:two-component system, OmpR family, response regulator
VPGKPLHLVTVLVVDDHPDTVEMLASVLSGAGADVAVAGSVKEARDRLAERRPRVLVCDLTLRDGDGYGLLREANGSGDPIAGVAVTGRIGKHTSDAAKAAGFGDFLLKPFHPVALIEAVERVLR